MKDKPLPAPEPSPSDAAAATRARLRPEPMVRSRKLAVHRWTRTIHVYTSMICFLVVLFFAATGLTLNHPTWTLGKSQTRATTRGTLPTDWRGGSTIDWLRVAEYLRATHGLRGEVAEHDADAKQGSITFKGPGYSADAFFQVATGTYDLTVEAQGLLGVMNDLHKGRDTRSSWKWAIDASAVFLVVISITGLMLQFFLRKRRSSALSTAVVGCVIVGILAWLTLR
jgi:uncharacterized protein